MEDNLEIVIIITYIIISILYIIVCTMIGIILRNQIKLKKDINNIIKSIEYIDILDDNIKKLKGILYDETNFIKDKLGIVIRHSNNIRDNVQVTKLNTANILKNVETKNKAKISYIPVKPKKSSDNNSNGQEKLKTA